jgi:hypothetical protein
MAGGGSVGRGIEGDGAAGAVWYSPRKPRCLKVFPWSLRPLMSPRTSIVAHLTCDLCVDLDILNSSGHTINSINKW